MLKNPFDAWDALDKTNDKVRDRLYKNQCATMKDWEFIVWMKERIMRLDNCNENVDYIIRMQQIADELRRVQGEVGT